MLQHVDRQHTAADDPCHAAAQFGQLRCDRAVGSRRAPSRVRDPVVRASINGADRLLTDDEGPDIASRLGYPLLDVDRPVVEPTEQPLVAQQLLGCAPRVHARQEAPPRAQWRLDDDRITQLVGSRQRFFQAERDHDPRLGNTGPSQERCRAELVVADLEHARRIDDRDTPGLEDARHVQAALLAHRATDYDVVRRRGRGDLQPDVPVEDTLDDRTTLLECRDQEALFGSQQAIDDTDSYPLHDDPPTPPSSSHISTTRRTADQAERFVPRLCGCAPWVVWSRDTAIVNTGDTCRIGETGPETATSPARNVPGWLDPVQAGASTTLAKCSLPLRSMRSTPGN
ncbi:hypothetical protein HRbin27_01472 [bacterium HR27]|nr:hypothetical protein HRbin27_01472 [bacterium HR27]